ncbi:MAG: Clp protease N-terminal domain-containing protein, partial [Actinomycetota bacterium]
MDLNRLTLRSRQALAEAQRLAIERNHPQVEPEHLLFSLLSDPEGVIYPLLHAIGLSPRSVREPLEERLERIPKAYGGTGEVGLALATRHILERAFTEAASLTDEYVSTEHLLLAMLEGATDLARLLSDAGVTRDNVLAALVEIRGRQRVTDENPEEKYQALERYGRDLTELARRG